MKIRILALVLGLAGCADTGTSNLTFGTPGLNVADAALRGGSPQVALQVTVGILARSPDNVEALAVRGDALTMLGQYDDASASFSRALQRDRSSIRAKTGLGRLRLATNPAEAEILFLEVLQSNPRDTTALNNLGIARDLQGRHQDAQLVYRQALGINPDMAAAQVNLALSFAMSGQGASAIRLIQPLASSPNASMKVRHDYAAVLAMSGRREEAERILSVDLSPAEVRQVMAEFEQAGRRGNAEPGMAAPPPPSNPVAPAGSRPRGGTPNTSFILPPATLASAPIAALPAALPASFPVTSPLVTAPAIDAPTGNDPADLPPVVAPSGALATVAQGVAPPAAPVAPTEPSRTLVASPESTISPDRVTVRISALPSRDAADAAWVRLRGQWATETAKLDHTVAPYKRSGRTYWSLRVTGVGSTQFAESVCGTSMSAAAECSILSR